MKQQKRKKEKNMIEAIELLNIDRKRKTKRGYQRLIWEAKKRQRKGKDVIIIVDGERGDGKSTLSMRIAYDLDKVWQRKPEFATSYLEIYSSAEFQVLVNYLMEHEGDEFYRGRYVVFEESGVGASRALRSAAAVQELFHMLDIMREYQINIILNVPLASEIEDLKFRYAHFHVFTMGVDQKKMFVRASLKKRVRTENQVAFVNPLLVDYKVIDEHYPGMFIKVDFCPPYHWALYLSLIHI